MPELITHCLVGEKVIEKIDDKKISTLLKKNKHEFILGCQGGDLFFFYNYGLFKDKKSVPDFGDRLHVEKVEEFFSKGIEYVKQNYSDGLLAYFLGYLCHYGADKEIHPFVYKKSNKVSTMHHNIEFMLGKQYLMDTTGKQALDYDMEEIFDFKLSDDISDLYIYMAKELYGEKLTKEKIVKSKQDFRDFKVKTQHPDFQYKLMSKIAKPIMHFDPMALVYKDKNDWQYFSEQEYADFVSKVLCSIEYSNIVIKDAYAYIKDKSKLNKFMDDFDGTDFCGNKN
jgi:hypothetical protein